MLRCYIIFLKEYVLDIKTEKDELHTIYSRFGEIDHSEWDFLFKNCKRVVFKKGDILNARNPDMVWMIYSGIAKSIYVKNDG